MKWIAITLLVGVFIAHDSANWLSKGSAYSPAAVFYMLQGAWTAVLATCLLGFVSIAKVSIWSNLATAALVIAIVEGLEVVACRLPIRDMGAVMPGVSLCDHVTGLPVSAVTVCLEIMIVAWVIGRGFSREE